MVHGPCRTQDRWTQHWETGRHCCCDWAGEEGACTWGWASQSMAFPLSPPLSSLSMSKLVSSSSTPGRDGSHGSSPGKEQSWGGAAQASPAGTRRRPQLIACKASGRPRPDHKVNGGGGCSVSPGGPARLALGPEPSARATQPFPFLTEVLPTPLQWAPSPGGIKVTTSC